MSKGIKGKKIKIIALLVILLVFIGLFSACDEASVDPTPMPSMPTTSPSSPTQAPRETDHLIKETPEASTEPEIVSVTISATGDCTLGMNYKMSYKNSFDDIYDRFGKSHFFKNVYDILSNDDFTIINLEGPLTNSKDRQTKLFNHIGRPEYAQILNQGSIEAVSFSNNHTYDYGQEGYEDTVKALNEAGISYAGDGVYGIYESKGIKIGFVSVNEHYDGKLVEHWLEEGIKTLREEGADLVLACIHWGRAEYEGSSQIDQYQIELGKMCIDWGYDLVIGNHPHVLQGINKYKGKYISNCLGNFCYGGNKNPRDKDNGIFQQTFTFVDGQLQLDDNVRFIPCLSSSVANKNNYQPTPATGKEAKRIIAKINALSAQFGVAFDNDGYISQIDLTDKDKAVAYYSIFKESISKDPIERTISYVGVDISSLELSDSNYLLSLFDEWAKEAGVTLLVGTKEDLIEAGYHQYAKDNKGRIFIYDKPEWSSYQLNCKLHRLITLLNYNINEYTAVYVNGDWEVQEGSTIVK